MSNAVHDLLTEWELDPGLLAALVIVAGAYVAGVVRARRWPARRTAAFLAGLVVLGLALQSGLHPVSERLLSMHMVQHLILLLVVPPLLLAGAPIVLALRTLPAGARQPVARIVVGPTGRVLSHPVFVLALFCAVVVGTHLPGFYDAAVRHPLVHDLEHVLYLTAALALWVPVLAVEPLPHAPSPVMRLLCVMAAMPPMIFIGVTLHTSRTLAYTPYADGAARYGTTAIADQHTAGLIMWSGGALGMLGLALAVFWMAVVQEERRAVLAERLREERSA
jgi:putative copper resistance protein D